MCAIETDFGHCDWQAPVLVQLPKPSSSILATMALARRAPSTRSLRQLGQRRYACCDEQHRRTVLAGRRTCAATYAGRCVHALVGILLRNRNGIAVGHRVGAYRDEAAGLQDLVVCAAVDHEVAYYGECGRAPRLDYDRLAVAELTHIDLAGGHGLLGSVGMSVDMQRAHTADTLAAVVVEGYRLLACMDKVVVENIHHFEERCVGRDVLDLISLERSVRFSVFLTPYLQCKIHGNSNYKV